MRIYLVRHAFHPLLGRVLFGRTFDIGLDGLGHSQAGLLARHFASLGCELVQCSPRRRTRETAMPIAAQCGCELEIAPALDELDAGEWSGRTFAQLSGDPGWQRWNRHRANGRAPGGESMRELQARIVDHVAQLAERGLARAVLVSHAEPIRAMLMHSRGIALDDFHQVEVGPASVSILDLARSPAGARAEIGVTA
jgi:broad specificity phosphatase PhoE